MPSVVQEHQEERNPRDEVLLADPGNFSSSKSMNNWQSDYNRCTNIPFIYGFKDFKSRGITGLHINFEMAKFCKRDIKSRIKNRA